jgi:hypothetical protein
VADAEDEYQAEFDPIADDIRIDRCDLSHIRSHHGAAAMGKGIKPIPGGFYCGGTFAADCRLECAMWALITSRLVNAWPVQTTLTIVG